MLDPYNPYNDPVFIDLHQDPISGMPISVEITNEYQKINRGYVIMNEIPDEYHKVEITGMYEVDVITRVEEYKVNYLYGLIMFHPDKVDGSAIMINKYYGRGIFLLPASRIYTQMSADGTSVTETMEQFIASITEYRYFGIYDNATNYVINNIVYYNGSTFICIKDALGNLPTNTVYWRCMAKGFAFRGAHSTSTAYVEGDVVTTNSGAKLFMCLIPNTNVLTTNTTYWQPMLDVSGWNTIINNFITNGQATLDAMETEYNLNMTSWTNTFNTISSNSNAKITEVNTRMGAIETDYATKSNTWNTNISNGITQMSNKVTEVETRTLSVENNYNNVVKPNAILATDNANEKAALAQVATTDAVNAVIDYNNQVAYSIRIPKSPVTNYADIATTYPDPANGWTVKTIADGKTYRYDGIDSNSWAWTDSSNTDVDIAAIKTDLGSLTSLTTTNKTTFVGAINEVDATVKSNVTKIGSMATLKTTVKDTLVKAVNEIYDTIGLLSNLTTTVKSNIVAAINDLKSSIDVKIGNLTSLATSDKSSLTNAINEVNTKANTGATGIGTLSELKTTDKTSAVNAINENYDKISILTVDIGDKTTLKTTDKTSTVVAINENYDKLIILNTVAVNVKTYGALGNGVADDTLAIQSAIDAVNISGGGVVFFPQGTYLSTGTINLKSNTNLKGVGLASIIKLGGNISDTLTNGRFITGLSIANVEFSDMQIDGNKSNNTTLYDALNFTTSTNIKIKNVNLNNVFGSAISLVGGCQYISIQETTIHDISGLAGNPGEGLYSIGSIDLTIKDVTGYNIADHLIYLDGSTGESARINLDNVIGYNCGSVDLSGAATFNVFRNCSKVFFNNCHSFSSHSGFRIFGISPYVSKDVRLVNCTAYDSKGSSGAHGFSVVGVDSEIEMDIIMDNCYAYKSGSGSGSPVGVSYGFTFQNVKSIYLSNICSVLSNDNGVRMLNCKKVVWNSGNIKNNGIRGVSPSFQGVILGDGTLENACQDFYISEVSTSDDLATRKQTYGFYIRGNCTNIEIVGGKHENINGAWLKDVVMESFHTDISQTGLIKKAILGTGIPTSGYWNKGDIIYNTDPLAGGYIGWVCVTSGAFGSWKGFGLIQV